MSWISLFSFIICGIILLLSFKHKTDIFSPGRVFGFVWASTLGLTDLKLSGLQHEWSLEIWIQVLIGPIAFLIGVATVYVINLNTEVHSLVYMRNNRHKYEID